MRRAALEFLHGYGEALRCGQNEQKVNVVDGSTGSDEGETFAPRDAANICV